MAFDKVQRTETFPRDEHVDIHVREVTLNADAPSSAQVSVVEIREYLKDGGVFGHGIVLPASTTNDLITAIRRVTRTRPGDQ